MFISLDISAFFRQPSFLFHSFCVIYVGLGIHMPWLVCGGPKTAGWGWHFPSTLYESQELLSIGRHSKSLYLLSFFLRQVVTNRDLKQSPENREMLDCLVLGPEWGVCITSPRLREHFGRGAERTNEIESGQASFRRSLFRSDAAVALTNTLLWLTTQDMRKTGPASISSCKGSWGSAHPWGLLTDN